MFGPTGEAIFLGIIQGVTEFLPISSDGHLALAEILFGLRGGLALNVMLHAGTLLATLIMLRSRVLSALRETASAVKDRQRLGTTFGGRDAGVVLLASLPTAVIGLLLREQVERWTSSPLAVGLGFLVTSGVLLASRLARPGVQEWPSAWGALGIGVAQGIAVLPGVSRSASTITLALWLGVKPERAFELSMLMSLPAVLGAILLEAPRALDTPGLLGTASVGALSALVTGLLALGALRKIVSKGRFAWFALWVLPLSLLTLVLCWR